jgi:O-antigen/teichoic acid export membrane protein
LEIGLIDFSKFSVKKFLNAFLSFGLATTIEKILGFVIVPIYTNQFSILEYGTIDLLATVVNISLIFGLLQLETAFQRFYYEYSGAGKKSFISTIFFLVILLSLLITVILFLFSKTISYWLFESDINAHLVRLAAVQIPLQIS